MSHTHEKSEIKRYRSNFASKFAVEFESHDIIATRLGFEIFIFKKENGSLGKGRRHGLVEGITII